MARPQVPFSSIILKALDMVNHYLLLDKLYSIGLTLKFYFFGSVLIFLTDINMLFSRVFSQIT